MKKKIFRILLPQEGSFIRDKLNRGWAYCCILDKNGYPKRAITIKANTIEKAYDKMRNINFVIALKIPIEFLFEPFILSEM